MKGLLQKEFWVGKKTYLAVLALSLLFAVLAVLVCLSMICGNLSYLPGEDPPLAKKVAGICIYLPFVLLMFAANGSSQGVYSDYESGWMLYSYTLPAKAEKIIGARYLVGVFIFAACFFYGVVHALVIHALTGFPLTVEILKNMTALLTLAVFVYAWNLPLALKYKTSRAVSMRVVLSAVVLYLVCVAALTAGWKRFEERFLGNGDMYAAFLLEQCKEVRDCLFPFAPFLILGMFGISFYFSVKIVRRREIYAGTSL